MTSLGIWPRRRACSERSWPSLRLLNQAPIRRSGHPCCETADTLRYDPLALAAARIAACILHDCQRLAVGPCPNGRSVCSGSQNLSTRQLCRFGVLDPWSCFQSLCVRFPAWPALPCGHSLIVAG
jgi:hypothetical protein